MNPPQPSSPPESIALESEHLSVHFGQRSAIEDVSVRVFSGQVTALLGPNGAGKSTLMRAMAGMIPPSHGECRIAGEPVRGSSRQIAYVPQRSDANWTFPISVLEAVLLGLDQPASRWRPYDRAARAHAIDALRSVRMDALADVQIGTLSGGQQQRVFLARAIMSRAKVMLLDEPFTGVDGPTQDLFIEILDRLRREQVAIVYATHDLEQARRHADQIILINRHVVTAGPTGTTFTIAALRETFGNSVIVLNDTLIPSRLATA